MECSGKHRHAHLVRLRPGQEHGLTESQKSGVSVVMIEVVSPFRLVLERFMGFPVRKRVSRSQRCRYAQLCAFVR